MTMHRSLSGLEEEKVSVNDILLDKVRQTPQDYIEGMSTEPLTDQQCAGWAEILCLSYWFSVKVLIFKMSSNRKEISLIYRPIGPEQNCHKTVCLLMAENHYDALKLDDSVVDIFTQHYGS